MTVVRSDRVLVPLDAVTSRRLGHVRSTETGIERHFRKNLWQTGVRYRLDNSHLPGRPDLTNRGARVAVFIDGCFWHGHVRCYRKPRHNADYWKQKIARNRRRRIVVKRQLQERGWLVLEFWGCEVKKDVEAIVSKTRDIIRRRQGTSL